MRIAMFAENGYDENGYEQELLHFAAQHGDLAQIERLIVDGSDVNVFDSLGMTPLHWAAKGEHLNVVAFLIKHGADVNAHYEPSIGDTALGEVAGNCSFEMARILVDAGADPSIRGWMQLNALDRAKVRKQGDGPRVYALLTEAAGRRRT
jgi:ankyrin repeat protein